MDNNWRKFGRLPDIGTGAIAGYWIGQALAQGATSLGLTYRASGFDGELATTHKEFVAGLVALGGRELIDQYAFLTRHDRCLVTWDDSFVEVDHQTGSGVSFQWGSTDKSFFDALTEYVKTHTKRRSSSGKVFVITTSQNGFKLIEVGMAGEPLIEDNYDEAVVNDFKHVVSDLQSTEPCGRVVLFDGPPGNGKSFAIRALLKAVPDAIFVMLPPNLVSSLSGPGMVSLLIQHQEESRPIILVIEDADECLVSRGSDNMGSISALLNLSDGILGATLNLRIIATTNAGSLNNGQDLDQALVRPGRLCRRIHIPKLQPEQASEVFRRLTGKEHEYTSPVSLADVYRKARDAGWEAPKAERSVGFKPQRSLPPDFFDLDIE
jgi:hypothetical protein